jgi:hypothetical protein
MGSKLHVESTLGQGSTFWFAVALPVVAAVTAPAPERAITGYTGRRRLVLVVDDTASIRHVLTAMLEPLGFTVQVAEDGQQALALAQQLQPTLILMDWWMPMLSGLDAVRRALLLLVFPWHGSYSSYMGGSSILTILAMGVYSGYCRGILYHLSPRSSIPCYHLSSRIAPCLPPTKADALIQLGLTRLACCAFGRAVLSI